MGLTSPVVRKRKLISEKIIYLYRSMLRSCRPTLDAWYITGTELRHATEGVRRFRKRVAHSRSAIPFPKNRYLARDTIEVYRFLAKTVSE